MPPPSKRSSSYTLKKVDAALSYFFGSLLVSIHDEIPRVPVSNDGCKWGTSIPRLNQMISCPIACAGFHLILAVSLGSHSCFGRIPPIDTNPSLLELVFPLPASSCPCLLEDSISSPCHMKKRHLLSRLLSLARLILSSVKTSSRLRVNIALTYVPKHLRMSLYTFAGLDCGLSRSIEMGLLMASRPAVPPIVLPSSSHISSISSLGVSSVCKKGDQPPGSSGLIEKVSCNTSTSTTVALSFSSSVESSPSSASENPGHDVIDNVDSDVAVDCVDVDAQSSNASITYDANYQHVPASYSDTVKCIVSDKSTSTTVALTVDSLSSSGDTSLHQKDAISNVVAVKDNVDASFAAMEIDDASCFDVVPPTNSMESMVVDTAHCVAPAIDPPFSPKADVSEGTVVDEDCAGIANGDNEEDVVDTGSPKTLDDADSALVGMSALFDRLGVSPKDGGSRIKVRNMAGLDNQCYYCALTDIMTNSGLDDVVKLPSKTQRTKNRIALKMKREVEAVAKKMTDVIPANSFGDNRYTAAEVSIAFVSKYRKFSIVVAAVDGEGEELSKTDGELGAVYLFVGDDYKMLDSEEQRRHCFFLQVCDGHYMYLYPGPESSLRPTVDEIVNMAKVCSVNFFDSIDYSHLDENKIVEFISVAERLLHVQLTRDQSWSYLKDNAMDFKTALVKVRNAHGNCFSNENIPSSPVTESIPTTDIDDLISIFTSSLQREIRSFSSSAMREGYASTPPQSLQDVISPTICPTSTLIGLTLPPTTSLSEHLSRFYDKEEILPVRLGSANTAMSVADIVKRNRSSSRSAARLNIIDFEFSHHEGSMDCFTPCSLARDDNLLHHYYSNNVSSDSSHSPFAKFVVGSEKGCHTGYHVDYYGCGVIMHVVTGCKLFFCASVSEESVRCCFDRKINCDVDKFNSCIRRNGGSVTASLVRSGESLFLPQGCVHAALTLQDTLAFTGNFFHLKDLSLPIAVSKIDSLYRSEFPDWKDIVRFAANR